MPTPDTSPKAVAKVLRECAGFIAMYADLSQEMAIRDRCRALADALEQTPVSDKALLGALSESEWCFRVEVAEQTAYNSQPREAQFLFKSIPRAERLALIRNACRAFAPELAPSDD